MKSVIVKIIDFIRSLLGLDNVEYFDLIDEYEDYVRGQDISVRNVLVGAVRSVRQYEVNYEGSFYHIPEGYIADPDAVEYVALYRSKTLFGKDDSGITHYGKVSSWELCDRSSITELPTDNNEKYYRFQLCEWMTLKRSVKPRELWPHVCLMTNKFLLESTPYLNQLLLSNNNEFKLYYALNDIVNGVYDGFFVGDVKVRKRRSEILIISPGRKKRYRISEFRSAPVGTCKLIYRDIFKDASQA